MSYRPHTDTWILCRPKVPYHGAFPAGFLERARDMLGVAIYDPVLHVCGGRVKDYQSGPVIGKGLGPNDRTVDIDADLKPDFLLDVRHMGLNPGDTFPYWTPADTEEESFIEDGRYRPIKTGTFNPKKDGEGPTKPGSGRNLWAASLIDRPYDEKNAAQYKLGEGRLPNLNDLLRRTLSVTRIGGRVGVLDFFMPRPPKEGVRLVALIGVSTGYDQQARWFTVFERLAWNPLEQNLAGGGQEDEGLEDDAEAPEPAGNPMAQALASTPSTIAQGRAPTVECKADEPVPESTARKKKRKVDKTPADRSAPPAPVAPAATAMPF